MTAMIVFDLENPDLCDFRQVYSSIGLFGHRIIRRHKDKPFRKHQVDSKLSLTITVQRMAIWWRICWNSR